MLWVIKVHQYAEDVAEMVLGAEILINSGRVPRTLSIKYLATLIPRNMT